MATKGARDGDGAVRRCRRIRGEGAGGEEGGSTEACGEEEALRRGQEPSAAVGKKITQTAVIKDPGALRSTVWLEIGPIWMERHPTRPEELIIKEISTRRTQQQ